MEIFINELSLHGQYSDQPSFVNAIKEFTAIFSLLDSQRKDAKLYKNEHQFFIDKNTINAEFFQQSFEKITNKQLKEAFRSLIFGKLNPKSWHTDRLHLAEDSFECELLNDFVSNTTLAEVAERNIQKNDVPRLLMNFTGSKFQDYNEFEVTKNGHQKVTLRCSDNKDLLGNWLKQFKQELDAILSNSARFRKTNHLFKKSGKSTPIYQEIATNYYWYADYYHENNKFHFEVFNQQIIHLGEADIQGNIIAGTSDERKNGKLSV